MIKEKTVFKECSKCKHLMPIDRFGGKLCILCTERQTKANNIDRRWSDLYQESFVPGECFSDFRDRVKGELMKKCISCGIFNFKDWMVDHYEGLGDYGQCKDCVGESIPVEWSEEKQDWVEVEE